jgi:hypothetical protein
MNTRNMLVMVLAISLLFGACRKQEDNDAFITILSPNEQSVINDPSKTDFLIVFSTTVGELYEVRVKAYPKNNVNDVILNFEDRADEFRYTYIDVVDLSRFPSGTAFIVVAETDRDSRGKSVVTEMAEFSIR